MDSKKERRPSDVESMKKAVLRKLESYWNKDYRVYYLSPVKVEPPKPTGSVSWTFSVKNLLGWTMGSITVEMRWRKDVPCGMLACDYSFKDQWTAPLIYVNPQVNVVGNVFPNRRCEKGMECCTYQIDIVFEGPINNIPYHNWYRVCADCSTEWG